MPKTFLALISEHREAIIRAWLRDVYAERRTQLPDMLSFGQLVRHLPDMLEELGHILDERADDVQIIESARRRRAHAQERFQQGALMDEVARELILIRVALNDFLWREAMPATQGNLLELQDALRRCNQFVDEMIAQSLVIYAAGMRPPVETRSSVWPLNRSRQIRFPGER